MSQPGSVVNFIRHRDYLFIKVLGQGACGQTVLLRDEVIDGNFVCKKYTPFSETHRLELFANFLREIKLLHEVYHQNVVRVFNYYLYPEKLTGYILMEYIKGEDIEIYLKIQPELINDLFMQAIEGFAYLESCKILHRDIRPQNIMVGNDGVLKIIDLGFGKKIDASKDFDKSITLNWWCEPPKEFASHIYNHATEVYFVGKLFEKLILEIGIEHFKHSQLLSQMCVKDSKKRLSSFFDVKTQLTLDRSDDIEFDDDERQVYLKFADEFSSHITKIEFSTKYNEDIDSIRSQMEKVYKTCMLETEIPDSATIFRPFIIGTYYYKKTGFPTFRLKNFLQLFRQWSVEKQRIALANLHLRLNAIPRYASKVIDDEIPF